MESVSLVDNLPLGLNYNSSTIYAEGAEFTSVSNLPQAIPINAAPGYLATMGIPLRGRDFRADENKLDNCVAIVNETFARRCFPGQDPLGKRFTFRGPNSPWWEIVGVVLYAAERR